MRLASLGNCSCRALGFSQGGVSRVFTRVCLLAKRQPRWIGRLFPLALLLASTVLMGAVPVHAGTTEIDVTEDLISFARWKTDEGGITESLTALYTLETAGIYSCKPLQEGETTKTLHFEAQLTRSHCQIGEVTGREANSIWDRTVKLKWKTPEACKANTALFFGGVEAKLNTLPAECDGTQLRNYAIPDLTAAVVNGGKIAVQLGMDIPNGNGGSDLSQDLIIGYWTPPPPPAPPECSDESIDWTTAATEEGWSCAVDGTAYEYADFHVFTVVEGDSTKICKSQLPINVNNQDNSALFCEQSAGVVRAVFDWANNSRLPDNSGTRLSWLNTITQFGSRAQGNVACGAAGETVSGRCANQLADGFRAFGDMAGPGGDAIVDLDISNLTGLNAMFVRAGAFNQDIGAWETGAITDMGYMFNTAKSFNQDISGWDTSNMTRMERMFVDAPAFNQNLSDWDVSKVTTMASMFKNAKAFNQDLSGWDVKVDGVANSSFDEGADNWCGLGFDNRGRPGDWEPSRAVSCAVSLSIDAPETVMPGDELTYLLKYHNESSSNFDGTLTLELPADVSVSDGGISHDGTQSGRTITWEKVKVPAGSSPEGGGGEESVRVGVAANVTDGTELLASATLDDGFETSVNDPAKTTVSAKSVLNATLSAAETVLPGEVIEYSLSVKNVGQNPTEGGDMTLTWAGDVPFTIEGNEGATCDDTSCRWVGELSPNASRSQTAQVRVGVGATVGATLTATLSASATNELEDSGSNASVTTEILALPLPELSVDLATQPQGVVDVGAQFTAFVDLSNTGNGPAGSTTVTLDIGSATYVGAAVGNAPSYDSSSNAVTWTVDNLDTPQVEVLSVRLQAPQAEGAVILKSEVSTTAAGNVITDSASRSLSVTGTAVLDLQLSLDPEDQLLPGDVLDMAFRFQNIGNSSALEVVLATETPVDTTLLDWPDYATCAGNDCSEGYVGAISLNLGTVRAKERATREPLGVGQ